ncbi:MAG: UbiA family prenyltransferase [Candidatus Altiarchaeota archaeon]|nr:UbiA family prenyltransferase [Candidatus Altiarchaeota archaeon]
MKNIFKFLFNGLRVYRISGWVKNLGLVVIALTFTDLELFHVKTVYILLITAATYCYAFSLNDMFDNIIENEKNYFSKIHSPNVKIAYVILPLFIILLSFPLLFSSTFFLMTYLCILLTSLYSVPPFRFRNRPFWDVLFNSLSLTLMSFQVFFIADSINFLGIILASLFGLYFGYYELIHQLSHLKIDLRTGRKTTAFVVGTSRIKKLLIYFSALIALSFSFLLFYLPEYAPWFVVAILLNIIRAIQVFNASNSSNFNYLRNGLLGLEGLLYLLLNLALL